LDAAAVLFEARFLGGQLGFSKTCVFSKICFQRTNGRFVYALTQGVSNTPPEFCAALDVFWEFSSN